MAREIKIRPTAQTMALDKDRLFILQSVLSTEHANRPYDQVIAQFWIDVNEAIERMERQEKRNRQKPHQTNRNEAMIDKDPEALNAVAVAAAELMRALARADLRDIGTQIYQIQVDADAEIAYQHQDALDARTSRVTGKVWS